MKRLSILALALVAIGSDVKAQAFDMVGPGTRTCAEFLSDLRTLPNAESAYFFWAQGFMSGSNSELRLANKPRRILNSPQMPAEAQQQVLRRFCQQHPGERFLFAVASLFHNLPLMKDR